MDSQLNTCGYFGKLPIRGDFIQRNLSTDFIDMWDQWLQTVISASQKTLNDQWLNTYLVSPIWRFFLSLESGEHYTGIMLPSVDKVGRYFPFTIAMRIAKEHNVIDFIVEQETWYQQAENIAIQALEENIDFDQLNQAIDNLRIIDNNDHGKVFQNKSKAFHVELTNNSLDIAIARIQSKIGTNISSKAMSYWWTTAENGINGNLVAYLGMPDDNIYVAMLDGQWQLCHINHLDTERV